MWWIVLKFEDQLKLYNFRNLLDHNFGSLDLDIDLVAEGNDLVVGDKHSHSLVDKL